MNQIERLFNNANNNHGLVLQPMQVRELAGTIMNMDRAIQELQYVTERYVTEHGDELLKSILEGDEANGNNESADVEAEVVTQIVEQGQEEEVDGIHPQVEEDSGSSVEVSEVSEAG